MNKLKLFIENFIVYGLGGIISKLIPLIMVPIVTRIMPTTDYFGISDLSNTVVQFGSAIAIMGMYDAMYRLFFEKDDDAYKRAVCSTALMFTFLTSVAVFLIMLIVKDIIAQYFFSDRQYAYVVYLSAMATLVGATNAKQKKDFFSGKYCKPFAFVFNFNPYVANRSLRYSTSSCCSDFRSDNGNNFWHIKSTMV